jgi:hypothetical protein
VYIGLHYVQCVVGLHYVQYIVGLHYVQYIVGLHYVQYIGLCRTKHYVWRMYYARDTHIPAHDIHDTHTLRTTHTLHDTHSLRTSLLTQRGLSDQSLRSSGTRITWGRAGLTTHKRSCRRTRYGTSYAMYPHSMHHTPIHPYTHVSTQHAPYTHAAMQPYTHTPIHSYTHTPIHPYTHTLIHPYNHTQVLYSTFDGNVKGISNYKFAITFENSRRPSYVTEKIVNPKLAHSVL